MKRLRNIISWILILTLCCGEFTPQLAVYAAGEETEVSFEEEAVSDDTALSGDEAASPEETEVPEEAVSEDAVSEDAEEAVSEDTVSRDEAVSEDAAEEETEPAKDEDASAEEQGEVYEDGQVSGDVEAPEETDLSADPYYTVSFKMHIDEKEARKVGVSVNQLRKEKNDKDVVQLTYDYGLEEKAYRRAAEIAIYYSANFRPDGTPSDSIMNENVRNNYRRELIIREGSDGAAAATLFKSLSANELTNKNYRYMAVGHVKFQGAHYWVLELTAAQTNLNSTAAKDEDAVIRIDILEKFVSEKGVNTSLANKSTIRIDKGKTVELPTFTPYIVSVGHKDNEKLKAEAGTITWKLENKDFGTIKNNKLTATAEEGTQTKLSTKITHTKQDYNFEYTVRVIVHVKSVTIELGNSVMVPDETMPLSVTVLPYNADDKSFNVKVGDEKIIKCEAPNKKRDYYQLVAYAKGTTTITVSANDAYNKAYDVKSISVNATMDVDMPYSDEITGKIGKNDSIRLYTTTPDAEIYYLTFGEVLFDDDGNIINSEEEQKKFQADFKENPELFTLYTKPITISENTSVRAIARKMNTITGEYVYSDHTILYFEYEGDVWGDVTEEDQAQWGTPDKIPQGFWVAASSIPVVTYNGKAQKPAGFRVYDANKLISSKEYTISYSNNVDAGEKAEAKFKFKGNYSGELIRYFEIAKASVSVAQIANAGAVETGSKITPNIKVTVSGRTLKNDVDYTVSCSEDIIKAGTYKITITGKGNYTDSLEHDFTVTASKKDIPKAEKLVNISGVAKVEAIQAYDYTGIARKPEPVVVLKKGGKALVKDVDYTVSYKNNVKAGSAKVIVTGLESAGYKGSITKAFKINKVSLKKNALTVDYDPSFNLYQKGGATVYGMHVTISINGAAYTLKEGIDYTVKYTNNKKPSSDKNAPYFVLAGKGGFKDKSERYPFTIEEQAIRSMIGTAQDVKYTGKAGNYKTKFVITDLNGKKLAAGTDYDKSKIEYLYDEDVEVMSKGKKIKREAFDYVGADDIIPAGTALHVAVPAKGNYFGMIRIRYKITPNDISKAKAVISDQTYTGEAIKLTNKDIRFTNMTIPEDGFEIIGYSNNTELGTAKVVVRGIGNYGGTVTIKFKIIKKMAPGSWIAGWKGTLSYEQ